MHKHLPQAVTITLQTKRFMQCFLQLTFKALPHLIYPAPSVFILSRRMFGWLRIISTDSHCTKTEPQNFYFLGLLYTIKALKYVPSTKTMQAADFDIQVSA